MPKRRNADAATAATIETPRKTRKARIKTTAELAAEKALADARRSAKEQAKLAKITPFLESLTDASKEVLKDIVWPAQVAQSRPTDTNYQQPGGAQE